MSNTYSATSTPVGEPRRPWRLLAVLLLLAFGTADLLVDVLPAYHRYRDERFSEYLVSAGVIAEEVEARLADPENDDPRLEEPITLVLGEDELLAAARVWSTEGVELCTQARNSITSLPAPTPDFSPLHARLKDAAWAGQAQHLQALSATQGRVVDALDAPTARTRNAALVEQDLALRLAGPLAKKHPALAEALDAMNAAMDDLTGDTPRDWALAQESARDARDIISDVLEAYRAIGDDTLPAPALAALAPAPESPVSRLFPQVRARRVLTPLFVSAMDSEGGAAIGFLETIFFDRPADFVANLGWRAYPAPLCLLGLLALLFIRRRREEPEEPEIEEIADDLEF
jgi:hypothetical protein